MQLFYIDLKFDRKDIKKPFTKLLLAFRLVNKPSVKIQLKNQLENIIIKHMN